MRRMFSLRMMLSPAVALLLAVAPKPAAAPVLPWIEDDYTRAVTEAKARKIPLFVESWAPW